MTAQTMAPAREFTSVPIQEPIDKSESIQEEVPKRKRGRPPRDPNAEPTPRRAAGRPRKANLETRIGGFMTRVNIAFTVAASIAPGVIHPNDPLTPPEIVALSRGLAAQAATHPTFRKYLEVAMATSDNADLVFVVGAIAVRRLANHGIVPEMIGNIAGAALENPDALAAMIGPSEQGDPMPESKADTKPFSFE